MQVRKSERKLRSMMITHLLRHLFAVLAKVIGGAFATIGVVLFLDGFVPKSKPVSLIGGLASEVWIGIALMAVGLPLMWVGSRLVDPAANKRGH